MEERYLLAIERIRQIPNEKILPCTFSEFFEREAEFLIFADKIYTQVLNGELCKLELTQLRKINKRLYENPVDISNQYLNALSCEIRSAVSYIFEQDEYNLTIRLELFLEFYSAYVEAGEDINGVFQSEGYQEPEAETLKNILYFYVSDYSKRAAEEKIRQMVVPEDSFAGRLILQADWSDVSSLYLYGEKVTDIEERTLLHLNSLPKETLQKMADTFTEGYRIGFETCGKDISIKKTVEIRYNLGFEPMVLLAVKNFEKIGLNTVLRRGRMNLLFGRGINSVGFTGASRGRQYEFDHKDDAALILDAHLSNIKTEALKHAYEKYEKEARLFGGPAVIEVFGEDAPQYVTSPVAPKYSTAQQKIIRKAASENMKIQLRYIPEEERSFTIIAFPTPDIGEPYGEIFDETIRINTLDYMKYRNIQQKLIDALDRGEYVLLKGRAGNETNLKIELCKLKDPSSQTIFENCVADVNIPVGEVFTSPVLKGTEGILHVSSVILNGLEYRNLKVGIKDGMVEDYSLENFKTEEENRKFFYENVLFFHKTLPVGEFAIGTNTTAYTFGRKFGIAKKLPILIAEKTGPHLALGDTCYSHDEESPMYNPDGKEVVARENECSRLRDTKPDEAYFDCHTDITIPFDELAEISVVCRDNTVIPIIEEGRFVLPGTEELNEALEQLL